MLAVDAVHLEQCGSLLPKKHFKWHIFHKMTLTVAPIGVNTERALPVDFLFGISVFFMVQA